MAVRNFWLNARVDGKQTALASGPRARDGGFDLTISQRDNGSIVEALEIIGRARTDGTLEVTVRGANGAEVHTFTTRR